MQNPLMRAPSNENSIIGKRADEKQTKSPLFTPSPIPYVSFIFTPHSNLEINNLLTRLV